MHADRVGKVSPGKRGNKRTTRETVLYLPHVRRTKDNCLLLLPLTRDSALPAFIISAPASHRSLARSRRESMRGQHMHSPDPVGDSKVSLGSLAKTTAT